MKSTLTLILHSIQGFRGLAASRFVAICASFSALGGLLFGYEYKSHSTVSSAIVFADSLGSQGVISVILVMDQFVERFPQVSQNAPGAGFYKGLMTAMITLGAFIGMFRVSWIEHVGQLSLDAGSLNQGWIADAYSRKYSITIAVVIFTIGSALQTAAVNYAMLVIARLIGGIGIGM